VGLPKDLEWYESRGNSSQFTPEKRLAVAILVDAMRLIHERSAESNEELAWLMGAGGYRADWIFSADSICDELNVDLEALRNQLRQVSLYDSNRQMRRLPTVYKARLSYREGGHGTAQSTRPN
jgi:hypothetical protein